MRGSIFSTLAAVAISSSVLAADLKDTIQRNNEVFAQAYNAGDAAGVAALYTEDAVILPPGAEMAEGREAIAEFWQGAIDSGMKDLKLEAGDVEEQGDAVREIGRFTATAGENSLSGKYVVVWKKTGDGTWQLDTDIWNLNGN